MSTAYREVKMAKIKAELFQTLSEYECHLSMQGVLDVLTDVFNKYTEINDEYKKMLERYPKVDELS